jgi:hypothetical protein
MARADYEAGRNDAAARKYRAIAEWAHGEGDLEAEATARRWCGNSLLWAARPMDALEMLLPVTVMRDPEVPPEPVYGAQTDVIKILVSHAPAARIRTHIVEADAYLHAVGKEAWRHRLDLLEAIFAFRRGEFPECAMKAERAWRGMHAAVDGPRYVNHAYFKWITRGWFHAREPGLLKEWSARIAAVPAAMSSEQVTAAAVKCLVARLDRVSGETHRDLALRVVTVLNSRSSRSRAR